MICLVSNQLFDSEEFTIITPEKSLELLNSWDIIQFDTETSGRNPHICKLLTAQFGNKQSDIQIVVDCTTIDFSIYKNILETKLLVGHNLKFDCQFCYKYKIIPSHVWDTMIVEQLLHLGYDPKHIKYSLQAVAERRLNKFIDKTIRGEIIWRGLDSRVIQYAAGDVVDLEDIMEQQKQDCIKANCLTGAHLENAFVPVIAYLEWCGVCLDVNKWLNNIKSYEKQKQEALEALNKWLYNYSVHNIKPEWVYKVVDLMQPEGEKSIKKLKSKGFAICKHEKSNTFDRYTLQKYVENPYFEKDNQGDLFSGFSSEPKCIMNWNSQDMVIPLLKRLGFDVKTEDKKTGEKKESMVEKLIRKQKGINDEFIHLFYDKYQEAAKVCSTYGRQYIDAINPITGRIHTTFRQLGASSGRMSCGNSKDHDKDLAQYKGISTMRCSFVQLQNLPADEATRSSFIPAPGNLMCSCDYSALESRLGADIYNEPSMIKEYLEGSGDIHSLTAKHCFQKELEGIEVKDIKKLRPDLRSRAKPVEFSQQFGGSAKAIQNSLGCSYQEAKEIAENYNKGFSGIAKFKEQGAKFVKEHGYIIICPKTGHKIYWEDWKKWKDIENVPEELRIREYTKEELKEHNMAGSKWARMALNSPTQGSGIIILKFAMCKFFKWIIDNNLFEIVRLCDLIHDEALIEFPKEMKDIVPNKLKECMEFASSVFCKKLPIPAVPETGDHWIH